MKRRPFVVGTR